MHMLRSSVLILMRYVEKLKCWFFSYVSCSEEYEGKKHYEKVLVTIKSVLCWWMKYFSFGRQWNCVHMVGSTKPFWAWTNFISTYQIYCTQNMWTKAKCGDTLALRQLATRAALFSLQILLLFCSLHLILVTADGLSAFSASSSLSYLNLATFNETNNTNTRPADKMITAFRCG